jgi:hypothetical protein
VDLHFLVGVLPSVVLLSCCCLQLAVMWEKVEAAASPEQHVGRQEAVAPSPGQQETETPLERLLWAVLAKPSRPEFSQKSAAKHRQVTLTHAHGLHGDACRSWVLLAGHCYPVFCSTAVQLH